MTTGNQDDMTKVLSDIILDAVLHPELPMLELVSREVLDRARMMIDHEDIVAAAARKRGDDAGSDPREGE